MNLKNKGKNVHTLQVLPRCLSLLQGATQIENPDMKSLGGQELFTGPEFVDFVCNKITTAKWNPDHLLEMATVLRDVTMGDTQSRGLLRKMLRQIGNADMEQLPAIVHQLLLFAKKGHAQLLLRGILSYFNRLDEKIRAEAAREHEAEIQPAFSLRALRQLQESVIFHFNFAIKQDHDLGAAFIKLFRALGAAAFRPFTLSLVLSVARTHRFEDKVMDALRTSLLAVLKDSAISERAEWLTSVHRLRVVDLETVFNEVIDSSTAGWEHITQSLVQFGVILMDLGSRAIGKPSLFIYLGFSWL